MASQLTFCCWKCERDSTYESPAKEIHDIVRGSQKECRTYYCTNKDCGKANEFIKERSQWIEIDSITKK